MKFHSLICTIFIASFAFISSNCSTSSSVVNRPNAGNTSGRVVEVTLQNNCPLEKTSWLVAETQFNEKKLSTLAEQLTLAALTDADKARAMHRTNSSVLQLTSTLQQFIDDSNDHKQVVSQDFYKEYINNRNSLCAVLEAIRRGSIKKEDAHKTAETAFRKIAQSFEKFNTTND